MSISPIPPPSSDAVPPSDAVGAGLTQLRETLTELANASVWPLDDDLLMRRLTDAMAAKASLDQIVGRLVQAVDDRDLARHSGASSTRALLMGSQRVSARVAGEMLTAARCMTDRTETTRAQWAAGLVSAEQAAVIAAAIGKLSSDIRDERVEAGQVSLLEAAQSLSHIQLQVLANHLVEVVDPDSADATLCEQLEDEEARARQATFFRGARGVDGIARFSGKIPNLHFDMLRTALEAFASPRRGHLDRDSDTKRPGHGRAGDQAVSTADADADAARPELTHGQRLGRAFCDLIEHLPTEQLPRHGVANASLVVHLAYDKLVSGVGEATLSTGGSISAGEARRLACNAGILPMVLGGDSAVLDLGRTRRLFDRDQRIALAHRDQGCIFKGCERPASWCEAHHNTSWADYGSTDLANGCLLCPFHHHLVHGREWYVHVAPDGIPEVVASSREELQRHPMRHERFRPRRE